MRSKEIFQAVVTVQGARLRPTSITSSRPTLRDNPLVDIHVMVPKGDKDVTVQTDCKTKVRRRTLEPVWNESFAIPVLPGSDVLVFRVHRDERATTLSSSAANSGATIGSGSGGGVSGASKVDSDGIQAIGVCLLPVAHLDPCGGITKHTLELFSSPNEPGVGYLFIAGKVRRTMIELLEIQDLEDSNLRKKYYSGKLSAANGRFLGIGELAAFLFEEGYSDKIEENWNRAIDLLSEQLAYRIYATTDSMNDQANFSTAKLQIQRDGGLWDGV